MPRIAAWRTIGKPPPHLAERLGHRVVKRTTVKCKQ